MTDVADRPPVRDWATDFDFFDPAYVNDAEGVFRELRAHHRIAHSNRFGGLHVLTRWQDVEAAAHDTATFSSKRVIVNEVPTSHPGYPLPPINYDPPEHTALRRLVLPFFSPAAVARWEEPIREICRGLLANLEGRETADLAVEYAQGVPSDVTARLLGVPLADTDQFRAWIHDLIEVGPTDVELLRVTTHKMTDYFTQLVAAHRANPQANATSYLIDQTYEGEPLSDEQIVAYLFLLLIGGIDTTWSTIGSALAYLASHPEDRRRLVADPSLIATATEEFLRAFAPVTIARVATTDTHIGDADIKAGEWVALAFPSINYDSEVFDQPEEILIDRTVNRHAAFGLGPHRCLGSNLARLEIAIALESFLQRFPDFSVQEGTTIGYAAGQVRGPRHIPVRLG